MSEPSDAPHAPWRQRGARRSFWPVFIGMAALFIIVFVLNQSKEFSHCIHNGKQTEEYKEFEKRSSVFIQPLKIYWIRIRLYTGCAGHVTDKNEGALVAIATIALSIFTFTLWRSTNKLWQSSIEHAGHANRAISVAERSAERQLRSYLTVEPGGISFWSIGEQPCGRITVRNRGLTLAYNVEIALKFEFTDTPPIVDISDTAPTVRTGDMAIAPDAHQNADIYSVSPIGAPIFGEVSSGQKMIVMAGVVAYLDAFEKPRKTRFCHIYHGANLEKEHVRYHHLGNSST